MEDEEVQPNPLRVRSGHLGYLTKLYAEVDSLLLDSSQHSDVTRLLGKIKSQYESYTQIHYQCVDESTAESSQLLVENHDKHVQRYQEVVNRIERYLKDIYEKKETPVSLFKSSSVKSHQSCSVESHHSRSVKSHHSRSVKSYQSRSVESHQSSEASSKASSQASSQKAVQSHIKLKLAQLKLKQFDEAERQQEELEKQQRRQQEEQIRQQEEQRRQQEEQRQQQEEIEHKRRQKVKLALQHEIEQSELECHLWKQVLSGEEIEELEYLQKPLHITREKHLDIAGPDIAFTDSPIMNEVKNVTQQVLENSSMERGAPNVFRKASAVPNLTKPKQTTTATKWNTAATTFVPSSDVQEPRSKQTCCSELPDIQRHPYPSTRYVPYQYTSQDDALASVLIDLKLPKPELLTFNGDSKDYQSFITNFMAHIGSKVSDPATRLTYLIQYCVGEVKQLLKTCMLMPPEEGFNKALALLKKRYGQNHLIARSYIDALTQGPPVKQNDVDSLVQFSQSVSDCHLVLSQLQFNSDMNSTETIRCITRRLPQHLHAKWVDQAAAILNRGREPCFNDLAKFIEEKASISNTVYGREYAEILKNKSNVKPTFSERKIGVSTFTTQVNIEKENELSESSDSSQFQVFSSDIKSRSSQVEETSTRSKQGCSMCGMTNHSIHGCYKFEKLPLNKKLEIIKSARLCFGCLKQGHISRDCDVKCIKCQRRHNVLLHDNHRT